MKLEKVHNVVKKVLIVDEKSRKNDNHLICETMQRMGYDVDRSFRDVMNDYSTPCLEGITRVRRKIQHEHPNLKDSFVSELRAEQEEIYRDYSKERI